VVRWRLAEHSGKGTLLSYGDTDWTRFESTKQSKLRFRALLSDGGRELRFERTPAD
jgi:hypothetical protein